MSSTASWTRLSASGIAIGLLRTALTESVGLIALVVLSRALGVEDFGRYGVAVSLVILVRLIALGGLSLGLTRRPRGAHPRTLSGLVWAEMIIAIPLAGAAIAAGLVLGGSWIGLMIGVAAAIAVVPMQVPAFLDAYRHMRFGRLAVIQIAEALPLYVGVIIIALLGVGTGWFGVAFALSALGGAVMARIFSGPLARPANIRAGWRALALVGHDHAFIVLSQALALVMIPFAALVGGAAIAGEVRWGISLAAPVAMLSGLIIPVLYVPLARMGTRALRANARMVIRVYILAIGLTAAALVPALGPIVPSVFGAEWVPVVAVGQASVLLLALIAVMELLRSFVQGVGRTRAVTIIQGATLIACLGALAIGAARGSALVAMLLAGAGVTCGIAAMTASGIDVIGMPGARDLVLIGLICAAAAALATMVPVAGITGALVAAGSGALLACAGALAVMGPGFIRDVGGMMREVRLK